MEKKMSKETEYIFHQDMANDDTAKVRHHSDDALWVVESYDPKVTRRMIEMGARVKPSKFDGHLFEVDAKQLIEFIAACVGLNVEFRKRKRPQLTPENAEKRRLRMAELNARQRLKI